MWNSQPNPTPAFIICWREHSIFLTHGHHSIFPHASKTSLHIHSEALQSKANKNQQTNKTHETYLGSSLFTENHTQKWLFCTIAGFGSGKPSKLRCKGISWSQHSVHQHLFRALGEAGGQANNTCFLQDAHRRRAGRRGVPLTLPCQ